MAIKWDTTSTVAPIAPLPATPPKGNINWGADYYQQSKNQFDAEVAPSFADRARETLGYAPFVERQNEAATAYTEGKTNLPTFLTETALTTLGATVAPVMKVIGKGLEGADYIASGEGAFNPVPKDNLYTQIKEGGKKFFNKAVGAISDIPGVQNAANSDIPGVGNVPAFERILKGANEALAILPLPKVTGGINKGLSAAEEYAAQQASKLKEASNARKSISVADEIGSIRQGYSKGRNLEAVSPKIRESDVRIAQSNVLPNSVDENGLIDTKSKGGAIDQYKKQTIDGLESIGYDILKQADERVNINQVAQILRREIEASKLPISVKESALTTGINNQVKALMRYADEFGNIPLTEIHNAKINETAHIDYTKPLSKTYRKSVARAYRLAIEETSKTNIIDINKELSKYYGDIENLALLHGMRVKGGRLGKLGAQITGNIVGTAVGTVIGGPVGSVVGGVSGGLAARGVQGKAMARTFGKDTGTRLAESNLLTEAKAQASKPVQRSLSVPDKAVGAKSGIPKTKEIVSLERKIKDNVEAQKRAIKAKDFTLVAKLKEAYDLLVQTLKDTIKKIKETPNKQGGFIKNPLMQDITKNLDTTDKKYMQDFIDSVSSGETPSKEVAKNAQTVADAMNLTESASTNKALAKKFGEILDASKANPTRSVPITVESSLTQEAKKYKTAEEFVKSQDTYYHTTKADNVANIERKGFSGDIGDMSKASGGDMQRGVFLYDEKSSADVFGKNFKNPAVIEIKINGKVYDANTQTRYGWEDNLQTQEIAKDSKIINQLRKDGYVGVKSTELGTSATFVFEPSAVKTKSQLTDIWNKAHSKP